MKPSEIRMTLILLAVIFGVSAMFLFGKALMRPSSGALQQPVAQENLSSRPSRQDASENNSDDSIVPPLPKSQTPESPNPAVENGSPPVATVVPVATATPVPVVTVDPSVSVVPAAPAGKTAFELKAVSDSRVFPVTPPVKPVVRKTTAAFAVLAPPPEKPLPHKKKGTIIFVFDDAGHNLKQLEPFLKLPFPCTIAVLPGLQYSGEVARRVRAAGKEVILHQPMQAINLSVDPGPDALKLGMTADQIKAVLRKNLAEVGPVVGINNHEGSLVTADRRSMEAVFDVVREKGIYFLDSRTTGGTVAPVIARERNMTIWERAVFLDNSQDKQAIIEAVTGGMKIAEKKGSAIMIGHIWSNDLANILTSMYPELVSQGFSLSTIAEIATNGDFDE